MLLAVYSSTPFTLDDSLLLHGLIEDIWHGLHKELKHDHVVRILENIRLLLSYFLF